MEQHTLAESRDRVSRHGYGSGPCDKVGDDAWCCSQQGSGPPVPNSNGTGVVILGNGASETACPGVLWNNGVVGNSDSHGVVHLYGGRWLQPTHFKEGLA